MRQFARLTFHGPPLNLRRPIRRAPIAWVAEGVNRSGKRTGPGRINISGERRCEFDAAPTEGAPRDASGRTEVLRQISQVPRTESTTPTAVALFFGLEISSAQANTAQRSPPQ